MIERYNSYRYVQGGKTRNGTRWSDEGELMNKLVRIDLNDEHYPTAGLPLISDGNVAYVNGDDSHGLIMGSTGSKKSRLLAMPMMEMFARAGESVVVTDPKGELYNRTSGLYAREGYKIKVINLRDPLRSNGWNPLSVAEDFLKKGDMDNAIGSINDLSACFFPKTPDNRSADPFWDNTSRALFSGLCGIVIERPDLYSEISMRTVLHLSEKITGNEEDLEYFYNYLDTHYSDDSVSVVSLKSALRGSDNTTANVSVSFRAGVQFLYSRQSVLNMLSVRDVSFTDLGTQKTVLYIIMPDEKTTMHSLVSLCIKQCYEVLIDKAQSNGSLSLPVRVNFLLDEFSNLPTIPDMSSMISAARSRNIRFYLVIQSLNQLKSKYEEDADTIRGNCNDWVFLTSREVELLKELQTLCGEVEKGVPLITVSQLQRLDKQKGEALILCERLYPYIAHLADIDEYPFAHIEPVPLPECETSAYKKTVRESNESREEETEDIQTLLEKKFNELFGKLVDD